MDWDLAIARNREALQRIIGRLCAMVGLTEGEIQTTLPRHVRHYVARVLKPAEAAMRRLMVIAALQLVVQIRTAQAAAQRSGGRVATAARPTRVETATHRQALAADAPVIVRMAHEEPFAIATPPARRKIAARTAARTGGDKTPCFPLLDALKTYSFAPRRRYARTFPRFTVLGLTEPRPLPVVSEPMPDDPVPAEALCRRLLAVQLALETLPAQARRLARWQARRLASHRPGRRFAMRRGRPPGHRKKPRHEADMILRECHTLALHAWRLADTS
ncbi:hypothetical protein [Oricola sp.]|uniref:hypothetical protein n=1 Tax=Oricola sp. TaxID=1979950 RepID=UPI0025FAB02B|nr:hypothetical protein [Oricola sp.]MCI5077055.1 hypothetical protein [Oricola sp.]